MKPLKGYGPSWTCLSKALGNEGHHHRGGLCADLAKIARDIKKDNAARAKTFVDELHDRCQRLGSMPRAFPLLPNWEEHGVRRRPHGHYLIFYRIGAYRVEILHVLHGARDYEAVLFPDA